MVEDPFLPPEASEVPEGGGGSEAPAAPSYPRLNLTVDLAPDRKFRLAHRICDELDYYQRETERRRQNCVQWRLAYEMMPPGTSNRWENSSDVPSPLSRIYTDSHHARLNQQILNAVPPFAIKAGDDEALANVNRIEECMESILDECQWAEFADQVHGEIAMVGNCFARVTYEQEIQRHPRIVVDHDQAQVAQDISQGSDPHDAYWEGVRGVKLIHEDVLAHDGPRLKVIPWEDGFIFPISARDPDRATQVYGIGERYMLSGQAMQEGAKRGVYDRDEVEKLLAQPEDQQPLYRRERLDEQGLTDLVGGPHRMEADGGLYREYECAELCWKMDVDDDGLMEWLVVVIHLNSKTILRLQYLEYEHGQPCYLMYRYIVRANELFGMGIPELIATFQGADTAAWNQLIDHHDLALNIGGNFFYDNTAGYYPDRFVLQLGRGIRVENLNGIKPIQNMQLPAEAYKLHDMIKDTCDRLTATSDPSLGKTTDTSKTLGEVQIVQSAAHMIFEDYAARVARQHAKVWDHIRWLVSQFGVSDEGLIQYRRTAAPNAVEFKQIPPGVLQSRIDFVPSGLQQLSDMGSRVQQATLARTTFIQDPLVANNIEARLILNEEYLNAIRYQQRAKLMLAIQKGVDAQRAVQQAEMLHGQGSPMMGPGGGGPPGAPTPGGAPAAAAAPPGAAVQPVAQPTPTPGGEEAGP